MTDKLSNLQSALARVTPGWEGLGLGRYFFLPEKKNFRNWKVGGDRWIKEEQQKFRLDFIFIHDKISFNFSSLFLTI